MVIRNRKINQPSSPGLPNISWRDLIKICRMKEKSFEKYGDKFTTEDGPYIYRDNGSNILGVAHLDWVLGPIHSPILDLSYDKQLYCPTLDDRAGAYALLEYLPSLMKNDPYDILLTTNEEKVKSTARFFVPPKGKRYKWIFSFDRAGTDCVTYQYDGIEFRNALQKAGWTVGRGSYSDIVDLEHLKCQGVNFGVGYHDQHTAKCYLSRNEFFANIRKFLAFWTANYDVHFPYTPLYNVYVVGKGFTYIFDSKKSKNFTAEDMEIIKMLEAMDYEFEHVTHVVPEDMEDLVMDYQAMIANEEHKKQIDKQRAEQLRINFEKTREAEADKKAKLQAKINSYKQRVSERTGVPVEKLDAKTIVALNKMYREAKVRGSEDNPTYSEMQQSRKTGAEEMVETSNEKTITMVHITKEEAKQIDNGKSKTFLDECITCHKPYEFDLNSKTLQCPDCAGTDEDVELAKTQGEYPPRERKHGLRPVAKIPLFHPDRREKVYEYSEETDEWVESAGSNKSEPITTSRKVRYTSLTL